MMDYREKDEHGRFKDDEGEPMRDNRPDFDLEDHSIVGAIEAAVGRGADDQKSVNLEIFDRTRKSLSVAKREVFDRAFVELVAAQTEVGVFGVLVTRAKAEARNSTKYTRGQIPQELLDVMVDMATNPMSFYDGHTMRSMVEKYGQDMIDAANVLVIKPLTQELESTTKAVRSRFGV